MAVIEQNKLENQRYRDRYIIENSHISLFVTARYLFPISAWVNIEIKSETEGKRDRAKEKENIEQDRKSKKNVYLFL